MDERPDRLTVLVDTNETLKTCFYVVKITFRLAGNGMPLCGGGHMPSQCDTISG